MHIIYTLTHKQINAHTHTHTHTHTHIYIYIYIYILYIYYIIYIYIYIYLYLYIYIYIYIIYILYIYIYIFIYIYIKKYEGNTEIPVRKANLTIEIHFSEDWFICKDHIIGKVMMSSPKAISKLFQR